MNAVGIDISKGKSMVAVARPFGEVVSKPFEIKHTTYEIAALIEYLHTLDGDTRIVMEHTGRYYEPMARQLASADFFVSAVNPKLIKDYGNNSLRKVKTDKADALKIARSEIFPVFTDVKILLHLPVSPPGQINRDSTKHKAYILPNTVLRDSVKHCFRLWNAL